MPSAARMTAAVGIRRDLRQRREQIVEEFRHQGVLHSGAAQHQARYLVGALHAHQAHGLGRTLERSLPTMPIGKKYTDNTNSTPSHSSQRSGWNNWDRKGMPLSASDAWPIRVCR